MGRSLRESVRVRNSNNNNNNNDENNSKKGLSESSKLHSLQQKVHSTMVKMMKKLDGKEQENNILHQTIEQLHTQVSWVRQRLTEVKCVRGNEIVWGDGEEGGSARTFSYISDITMYDTLRWSGGSGHNTFPPCIWEVGAPQILTSEGE